MVDKFLSIRNVGKFKCWKATGDVTLRQTTVIYADNAQGKTTLSAILRSLSSGDPAPILERRTLGQQEPPEVEVLVAGADVRLRGGTWSQSVPYMAVFDTSFVHDNVYQGDAIGFDQRRNLHRFAIGAEGVKLAHDIEKHTAYLRQLNDDLRDLRSKIAAHNADLVGRDVDAFVMLEQKEGLDGLIEEATKRVEAMRQAGTILQMPGLSELPLPRLPLDETAALLAKQLEDVSTAAEQRVREHLSGCAGEGGESWIRQGMDYIRDGKCPFCGQNICGLDLIRAYREYFSEAYAGLKNETEQLLRQLEAAVSERHLLDLQRTHDANAGHEQFWSTYVAADWPTLEVQEVIQSLQDLKAGITRHMQRKMEAPLEPVALDDEATSSVERYRSTRRLVDEYNTRATGANSVIEAFKAKADKADLAAAEGQLRHLKTTKLRHSEPVSTLCAEYLTMKSEKEEREALKEEAKERLGEHTRRLLGKYQQEINENLGRCGADFTIEEAREVFHGGNPSVQYCLAVAGENVPLEEKGGSQPEPCFRNTLSSGDRTTLAFAFFLASVQLAPNIRDMVVVFDDPVSSLDCFRRTSTEQAIRRLAEQAAQVIVLSHDRFFLRDIWERIPCDRRCALSLARTDNGSALVEWNIREETRGTYEDDFFRLKRYLVGMAGVSNDALRSVAQSIRPLLEHYLRVKFPDAFAEREWLGDMVRRICEAQPGDPLYSIRKHYEELAEICEYSAPFHHDQNSQHATHLVTDAALKPYVARALEVVRA